MSLRLVRSSFFRLGLAFIISSALLLFPCLPLVTSSEASLVNAQTRMGRPRPGAPEAELPNLEEIKQRPEPVRFSAPPIPSTIRAPKVPLQPWNGRRVGDVLGSAGVSPATEREARTAARVGGVSRDSFARSNEQPRQTEQSRAHHARARRVRMSAPPPLPDDSFINNFFSWALVRTPTGNEPSYWNDQFRRGYTHGQGAVQLAAIELGKTLFESAEYAARNRDNHWYVYDLYKTYLMREPDAPGWAFWEGQVPISGRENVRRAFEDSGEFASLMATITPNGSASSDPKSLITARTDPRNQPANGLLTRDATWSVGLLSLPGRAGLDLGLGLSYSSMVWTRSGPYIYFDEDTGFPSPGFRIGFPTMQRKVFNAQTITNGYLLITGGGRRVELRQVGTSNIYEAADSSYLQLTDNGGTKLLRSTDGTQMTYQEFNNELRCTQIKDRNGNFITVSYNGFGQINTIIDTLSRTITFNYDTNANLLSITQNWGSGNHQWVSFGWGTRTMQTSFTGVSVIGPKNGTVLPVITQVSLNDGSYFQFDYTNSLQVFSITRKSFDNVQRSQTVLTYETPASDAPRLIDSRVSASNWTGINGVPAQVMTQYNVAGDGACVLTAPDGTIYKEYYGTGWQKGLTTLSEVWSGGVRQKWTTATWTQDNTTVGYEMNPRVTETNVYDAGGNRRRTSMEYTSYGLPNVVREWTGINADTLYRTTTTGYRFDSAYVSRRIIGLVDNVQVTNGAGVVVSKFTYGYDWDWGGDMFQDTPAAATQHDRTNYGPSFIVGRGNLSQRARWDADDPNNINKITELKWRVNSTGAVLMERDHLWHQKFIAYGDNYSDSINRNTFAYPTTLTDEDGFSSTVQYNFDIGGRTRTQGPPPAGQSQGAIQTVTYDSIGRVERTTTVNNSAYTKFVYGPDYVQSFATVNNIADEAYSIQVFDGVGRVIGSAGNHPGITAGYKAQMTVYDQLGRAIKSSNPAEITGSWVPAGDDAAGWLYTQQTYDWQGRPLRTTHPDTTYREASYNGCGCAGGEVVTLTDEGTLDGGVAKRRQQKIHSDVLGRPVKTEIFEWQGGNVYSTTVNSYNARNQITMVRQYAGAEGSGTYQDTTMTYDGHGRLKTRHVPEQNAGTNTVWSYNADDTINTFTDARGVITTHGYNARHLVTSINYSAPQGITPTANVTFGYDAASNRTSMTDGQGSTSYSYDQLSRMLSETRTFTGLGSFGISYLYNLANQLSSITNPFNDTITYTRDTAGRLTAVTGTTFGTSVPVSTYASNIKYRAWDGIKQLTSGDNKTLNATFNSRMLTATFSVTGLISKTYDYFADGKLRFSSDLLDHRFDRSYAFDHAGRLTSAFSGAEARGEGSTTNRPYYQTYGYDWFNHLTQRTVKIWWTNDNTVTHGYTNNRHHPQGTSWQYDADGRLSSSLNEHYTYDAAGFTTHIEVPATYSIHTSVAYDGDGQQVRTDETNWDEVTETEWTETKHYLRSSVLGGQVLTEILGTNAGRTFVFAGGSIIAWQWAYPGWESVEWEHKDPSAASVRRGGVSQELDPLGGDAGISAQTQIPDEGLLLSQGSSYSAANPNVTYSRDGIRVPADDFMAFAGHELRDTLGLIEAFARQRAKPDLPTWIHPEDLPNVEDRIALEEALLSGKGIPDLLALLPPVSLAKALSNPQNPAATPSPTPRELDCHGFADYVQMIADKSISKRSFMDELARTFTGAQNSSWREMLNNSAGAARVNTTDDGFRAELRETQDTHNQARHYVGGFIAAAHLGESLGRRFMNDREVPGLPDYDSDTALNRISTSHGSDFIGSAHGIDYLQRYLARRIRIEVCGDKP